MAWSQRSKRNLFGWTHLTCSASLLNKWSRLTTKFTISTLDNTEISFRKTHRWTIINQMIDNLCNHTATHIVYSKWNWTQFNNCNNDHLRRTGVSSDEISHASYVESQDTWGKTVKQAWDRIDRDTGNHRKMVDWCHTEMVQGTQLTLPRSKEHMIPQELWN